MSVIALCKRMKSIYATVTVSAVDYPYEFVDRKSQSVILVTQVNPRQVYTITLHLQIVIHLLFSRTIQSEAEKKNDPMESRTAKIFKL